MGLLPLTSVEPESISSPFHMIIRAGYKVSALSVLNLGAYNKANCVFVALITLECMYPRCQHREGSAQRIGSRQLFLNPCLDLQTGARGEGKGAGSWGRLTCRWLQHVDLSGSVSRPFGVRQAAGETVFWVYNWSQESGSAFGVVLYYQCCVQIVAEWLACEKLVVLQEQLELGWAAI